jgi:hypothetical protein
MLRDLSSRLSNRFVPTLTLACLVSIMGIGCGDQSMSVGLAALGITTPGVVVDLGSGFTRSTSVTLTVTPPVASVPVTMCVSNTSTCTFIPFASSKRWLLTPGDGTKTVSVTLQDRLGIQTPFQATVDLDATAPVAGTLTATPSDSLVSLSWDAATDALSGIQGYRLLMSTTTTPTSCNNGQPIYQGPDTSYQHTNVWNGGNYGYRVCPIDLAGNTGIGATAQARPAPEYDPPTGTVVINTGDLLTRLHTVTLDLDAADASPITSVCISQTPTCTSWAPYATTKTWTLRGPNGLVTINVWFRDSFGNTSAAPTSATITLDTLAPSRSTITTIPGRDGIDVSWTAATDINGVASYTLVWMAGTLAPASCSAGTVAYMGTDLMYFDAVGPSGYRSYRLCATDEAGNVNVGAVKTVVQPISTLVQQSNIFSITATSAGLFLGSAGDPSASRHTLISSGELRSWTAGLSRVELMQAVHEHILQTVSRSRDPLSAWDVVNAAIDDDTLQLRAGIHATLGVSGLAQVFKWVEEADPGVELYYSDYGIEGSSAKTAAVQRLVQALIDHGARIDGIGTQADRSVPGL